MTTVKYTVESTTAIYDVRDHGVTQLEPVGQPCCKDNHDDLEATERHLEQDSLEWVLDESFNDQTTEGADTVTVKKLSGDFNREIYREGSTLRWDRKQGKVREPNPMS